MSLMETMPETVRQRWRTAGRFADVLETEVKARRSPFIARVVTWFNLCRLCQDLEEQLLFATQPPTEDIVLHRALLSLAIGAGEGLLLEVSDPGDLKPLGITDDSIEAKIESLRITFEQWHTDIHPARKKAILTEVFGAEA